MSGDFGPFPEAMWRGRNENIHSSERPIPYPRPGIRLRHSRSSGAVTGHRACRLWNSVGDLPSAPRRLGDGDKIACSVAGRAANVKSAMSFYSAFCLLICLFILARFVVFSDLLKIIFHWFRSKYFTFQANFFAIRSGIFIFGNGNALDWRVANVDQASVC